jgi:hypothetical protein
MMIGGAGHRGDEREWALAIDGTKAYDGVWKLTRLPAEGWQSMVSAKQILEGPAEEALRWLDRIEAGQIEAPEDFNWASFHQMCRDYIRGYYLETFHPPRPDLQPVDDKIDQIRRKNGTWQE